jgi:leucyl-tRNA---protein transferase
MPKEPIYITPDKQGFRGSLLDAYLAQGFYRMQHKMFTLNYMRTDYYDLMLPMFWLRTKVNHIIEGKTAKHIRKTCKNFSFTYKKAQITDEINELYRVYQNAVNFSVSETCASYLHQVDIENPFDSMMVEIKDDTKLIAVGYFDQGSDAIAGILNFYDPAYKKYSLGKYLILKKLDFALSHKISFYYTGYISTIYTKFDYKIYPDGNAIEVLLPIEKEWKPYAEFNKELLENYFYEHIHLY